MSRQNSSGAGRRLHRRSFMHATAAGVVGAGALAGWSGAGEAGQPFIEAYAGRLSYLPGERVSLHVSTSAPRFGVEVARVGARREVVFSRDAVPGALHPVPANASAQGCAWHAALEVSI